jgi:hypothetical protein
MPDTAGYPRTKAGKNSYISKCIEVAKKENPGKSQDAILGQCEGMWKSKWNEKKKSNASLSEEEFWNDFSWASCEECAKMEREANGIFEIDIPNGIF